MARWIIKGDIYECPICHATFNNYFRHVRSETSCPCCGESINSENNQEVEKCED